MSKIQIYIIATISCLMLAGCLKSLEEEGVATSAVVKGTVVIPGGNGVKGMRVQATNGERYGEETFTSADGTFSLSITYEELHNGYYLLLTADSLYTTTIVSLSDIGFGTKEYDLQYITVSGPQLASVSTDEVSAIGKTTAVCGGTVSDNGRSAIQRRGICWNISPNPTVVNSHIDISGGIGHFTAAMSNLNEEQTYYVRAFAVNSVGVAYGEQRTFTTISGKPLVVTGSITGITQNSANCTGSIENDYGSTITARGFCWSSVNSTPTINDQHSNDGAGAGSYSSTITGLLSNTKYYIRAYATNANGTGYGAVKQFTTF